MDDIQDTATSITDTSATSGTSSAPVTDIGSASAAPSRPTRGGRTSSKKPVSTDEKFAASMEQIYNRATSDKGAQQSATPDLSATPDNPAETPDALALPQAINGRTSLDVWAATPREMQELVLRREAEVQEKITQQGQELAELRKSGGMVGELASVLDHFTPNLPPHVAQMPRVQQIAALYAASEALDRDPVGSLQKLAAQYGLDLAQIAHPGGQQANPLQEEYQQLAAQCQQLAAQHQRWEQQRLQHIERQILDYARDKPHFGEIEDEVIRQIAAVKETNPGLFEVDPMAVLQAAEKRALAIVPGADTRSAAEARKKADEAKRLASINVKSNAGKSPTSVSKDMWDTGNWESAYDKIQNRR